VRWFEKMQKKFQKFPLCRLQDISIWIEKNLFFSLVKTQVATLHKVTLWLFFGCILQGKLVDAWKILDHLELYNI